VSHAYLPARHIAGNVIELSLTVGQSFQFQMFYLNSKQKNIGGALKWLKFWFNGTPVKFENPCRTIRIILLSFAHVYYDSSESGLLWTSC